MNIFPSRDECSEFLDKVYKNNSNRFVAKKSYEVILLKFKTPKEFLSDFNNINILTKENKYYGRSFYMLIIFLSLKCKMSPQFNIQQIRVCSPVEIINYFSLVSDDFWNVYDEKVVGADRRRKTFLVQIIKALIYLKKENIKDINYNDLLLLRNGDFFCGRAKTESFPSLLKGVLAIINKKTIPNTLLIERQYGIYSNEIIYTIEEYLQVKYISKGYQDKSPLYSIKKFFEWLSEEYGNILCLDNISNEQWINYRKYIHNNDAIKDRTKQARLDLTAMFLEWCQTNNKISRNVVEHGERYKESLKCKPRMFNSREDYKKILKAIIEFKPINEKEKLVKNYLLIISSTGLRAREVLWLGPNCLIENDNESAEVILQVKEKLGVKNKTTSVLKWGIEPLKELQQRFDNEKYKIKFYNNKTKEYFYSIFQENERILSLTFIYKIFNRIMNNFNLENNEQCPVNINSVKMHGFRHQKFNDIYYVSKGSLTAVKIDSGHRTIKMTKTYTQQDEKQRQLEALKLINNGSVVGKGAEIIKALLKTPYSAERYLKIVKKMNVSLLKEKSLDSKLKKYLGFGFCAGKSCTVKNSCERCDFFYTCKIYLDELKARYSKNFALLISTVDNKENIKSLDKELAIDLKYQEKWLYELGMKHEEINNLRIAVFKEE